MNTALPHSGDYDAIFALIEARARSLRECSPAGTLATQVADFVQYGLSGPLQFADGNRIDVAYLTEALGKFDGPVGYEVFDQHIHVGGDVAFSHSLARISGSTGGRPLDMWFRKTLTFLKQNGAWSIAHEHESVPIGTDGSAAVGLHP